MFSRNAHSKFFFARAAISVLDYSLALSGPRRPQVKMFGNSGTRQLYVNLAAHVRKLGRLRRDGYHGVLGPTRLLICSEFDGYQYTGTRSS
ncbi:uncharacterized protein BT62DRAFT_938249 [Guyanagaster necrorhizus]|uniref:Uncharacterized protein n=1 Tax=Guyanagaster necrorhizus TaxID=856835 RepID=A0A9P8ALU9_9AGAR|nr:uncharacterized protein BT62DRAFT_938249 [Guyanagaster necrorhizus MCA 3950]KAG7440180.1 hypothetical protein BT62DRAFT_938249 [Guyanagaster necrorhizus MCA 3950]